jgi:chemotaxis signal transduction protein
MSTVNQASLVTTEKGTRILIANFTKQYIGKFVMQIDGKKHLKQIEKALDISLTTLDCLRSKTAVEETQVMQLLREQRLLQDNQT